MFDWLDELTPASDRVQLSLQFEYVSSSSVISIKQLLSKIKALNEKGINLQVFWHYDADDPDIKEIGEEYKRLLFMDIQLVENPAEA